MATVMVMAETSISDLISRKNVDFYSERPSYADGANKNGDHRSTAEGQSLSIDLSSTTSLHAFQRQTSSNSRPKIYDTHHSALHQINLRNQMRENKRKSSFNSGRLYNRIRRFTVENNLARHDLPHLQERESRIDNSSALPNPDLVEYRTVFSESDQNNNSTKINLGDSKEYTKLMRDELQLDVADGAFSVLSEQLVLPLVNFTQLLLRKCNCPKSHVSVLNKNGHLCSAFNAAVIDVLVRPIYNEIIAVGESSFAHVKVENLTCSHPKEIVHMTEREFILLLSGEIRHEFYNTLISPDQYCVEFIQYPNGRKEWVAMGCVDPPYIKKCCQVGYTFDYKQLQCVENSKPGKINSSFDGAHEKIQFQPPLQKDEALLHFGVDLSSKHGLPACSEGETIFGVKLGKHSSNHVQLIHFLHEIKLFVSHEDFAIQKYYKNSEFCVDGPMSSEILNQSDYVAVFCYDDPHILHHNICTQKNKHCIRKCCPHNQIIDMVSIGCREPFSYHNLYKPYFHKSSWYDNMIPVIKDIPYEVVFGEPLCHPVEAEEDNFYLLDDGTVYLSKQKLRFASADYCVDARQGYFNQTDVVVHYCPFQGQLYGDSCWRLRVYLYPITLFASCLFLLFTLILYKVVPELRMNISGKSLVSHVFSLLLAFLCLLIIFMGRLSERNVVLCQVMAFVTQYSYLATFFWLSAMCFEMWYRIRFLPTRAVSLSEARYKYKIYSAYGWGTPAVITAVTSVVHMTVPVSDQSSLTPNFGNPYCWFRDEPATWLYFSGIVTLLCVANIFFFLDLANISLKQCLGSSLIHVSRQQHMERILLCLKLFIVMGVTWIFEEISYQDGGCARWIPTDLINILRGPCVFLSVVSTRSVINKDYSTFHARKVNREQSNCKQVELSSHLSRRR
ncbi:GPCR family 2 secretin-like [Trinorchestia longiramus]|nr:GPCR family 2 secretin-like [Trinorchestia longiramus]